MNEICTIYSIHALEGHPLHSGEAPPLQPRQKSDTLMRIIKDVVMAREYSTRTNPFTCTSDQMNEFL